MNTFQRYLVDEFAEDYQERRLTRRDALKLIASVTGSLVIAESILAACAPAPLEESTAVQPATPVPEMDNQPEAIDERIMFGDWQDGESEIRYDMSEAEPG